MDLRSWVEVRVTLAAFIKATTASQVLEFQNQAWNALKHRSERENRRGGTAGSSDCLHLTVTTWPLRLVR